MATLVDTNVLLRLLQPSHYQYGMADAALAGLRKEQADLCIAPQNLVEVWVVATRPVEKNGLGMSPLRIAAEIQAIRGLFRLLEGKAGIVREWEELVSSSRVSGKLAHDAHLVATMKVHAVKNILTFNVDDFGRFPEIRVLDPGKL
jgi:predicted nucleic acid-binding protein